MKKYLLFLLVAMVICGCSKHDPILPGVRHEIFESGDIKTTNNEIPDLSESAKNISGNENCNCRQDKTNTIWCGDKKVYSGLAGTSTVICNQSPICIGNHLYTGLSSGEVIKIDVSNKKQIWSTDVYAENDFMAGVSVVDIIAHVGFDNGYIYAGGLGDAFCKINAINGNKIWCLKISVPVDFIIVDNVAFVVGADNNLYAINTKQGDVYWKTEVKKQITPKYDGNKVIVGKQRINYKTGEIIK